jgi:predicted ATPase/DNA-binding winged helix-turn-helix (wHTH) protein
MDRRTTLTLDSGRVELDLRSRQLAVNGQPARIGGRAFDVLLALLERHDRVVPKQELLDVVWTGLVVEENNLQVHVMSLRRVLGAAAILTVSGRGYRLTLAADTPAAAPAPAALAPGLLLGRDSLLADARHRLALPGIRLLTLTGAGGVGKTRVALHIAAERSGAMDDGAFVVRLAAVRQPEHLMAAIAGVLGVQSGGDAPLDQLVQDFLKPRKVLLVLDNLEQLAGAGPDVAALLQSCPQLQVLATSRSRLHLAGEQVLAVPPLALPDDATPAAARASPAIVLFAQRAAEIGCDVLGSADSLAATVRICKRLDGLPLALELAAARLRVLSPLALADRLQQALPLLKGGGADRPARQQALRDTLDWSHTLLPSTAQRLFRRLGVFVGGWSLEAAESIDDDPAAVLDLVELLLDHHLVQRIDDVADAPRYTMLETVREYALQRLLDSGEAELVRGRHAAWFARLAHAQDSVLRSAGRPRALALLGADRANLRAAMGWADACADQALAASLAGHLGWWWYFDDALHEGEAWVRPLLERPAGAPGQARVLASAARLALYRSDTGLALDRSQAALDAAALASDVETEALVLNLRGIALLTRSREAAHDCQARSLALYRALGDPWGVAFAVSYIGVVLAWDPGCEDAAEAHLLEGRARFEALGDLWGWSTSAGYLGQIAERRGDLALARRHVAEGVAASQASGDPFRLARGHHQLAHLALCDGDIDAARRHERSSIDLRLARGHQVDAWRHCRWLARLHWLQGNVEPALQLFAAAAQAGDALRNTVATTLSARDDQACDDAFAELLAARPDAQSHPMWRASQVMLLSRLLDLTDPHAA